MFFQTLVMNSPFAANVMPGVTYAVFDKQVSRGKHPLVWTSSDLDQLLSSGFFFARKFDQTVDAVVLDQPDELLDG